MGDYFIVADCLKIKSLTGKSYHVTSGTYTSNLTFKIYRKPFIKFGLRRFMFMCKISEENLRKNNPQINKNFNLTWRKMHERANQSFRHLLAIIYTGCLKNVALKLLYRVQKHLVGKGKMFKKFSVFISLHNGNFV
jgi:hypothetical protein